MFARRFLVSATGVGLAVLLTVVGAQQLLAHCDGLDGPVVQAARRALDSGNVNLALIWVQPADEPEARATFQQAVSVRKLGPQAAALAERHFFETLVRLHRAGEGAPYTGLKPAGRNLGPAIPAADRALTTGRTDALEKLLVEEFRHNLREHFAAVRNRRSYDASDVARGREYVKAYVEFIQYVERLHDSATGAAGGHYAEEAH